MQEIYDPLIALVDYIPNILFILGIILISGFLNNQNNKREAIIFLIGGIITSLGGFLKATWKLFMALASLDFPVLSEFLFVFQAVGFVLMLVALIIFFLEERSQTLEKTVPIAPIALWKIPFMMITFITSLIGWLILAYISWKRELKISALLYIISTVLMVIMVGIGMGEMTIPMQWVAEITNTVNQACFVGASYFLFQSSQNIAD